MRDTILVLFVIALAACSKKEPPPKSSAKSITSFIFKAGENPSLSQDVVAKISHDSILIELPEGLNVSNLVPTISYSGTLLAPASKVTQNFANPVIYTVTAEDGSTKTYRTQLRFLSGSKEITSFVFKKVNNPSLVEDLTGILVGDSIFITVLPGTNIKSLIPTIVYNGASIFPNNEQAKDFTYPGLYEVKAEDGTRRDYTVFVGANSNVFAHGNDGYLYGLNGLNGTIRWKYFIGGNGVPTYENGVLFAVGDNNVIYAIDAMDGTLKWKSIPPNGNYGLTIPVVKYGKIYVGGSGYLTYPNSNVAYYAGFVYTVNQETGNQEWISTLPVNYSYTTSTITNVTVDDNIACVYDLYNGLFVFDASTGAPLWNKIGDMLGRGNPAISNNNIYYGIEGGIRAVHETDGSELWHIINYQNFTSPTLNNGILYVGAANHLYAINPDGSFKWQSSLVNDIINFYSPVVGNNSLYVSDSYHLLSSYSTDNGLVNWTKEHFLQYPLVANSDIFICDDNGHLNCLDASSGNVKWIFQGEVINAGSICVVDSKNNSFHIPDSGEQN